MKKKCFLYLVCSLFSINLFSMKFSEGYLAARERITTQVIWSKTSRFTAQISPTHIMIYEKNDKSYQFCMASFFPKEMVEQISGLTFDPHIRKQFESSFFFNPTENNLNFFLSINNESFLGNFKITKIGKKGGIASVQVPSNCPELAKKMFNFDIFQKEECSAEDVYEKLGEGLRYGSPKSFISMANPDRTKIIAGSKNGDISILDIKKESHDFIANIPFFKNSEVRYKKKWSYNGNCIVILGYHPKTNQNHIVVIDARQNEVITEINNSTLEKICGESNCWPCQVSEDGTALFLLHENKTSIYEYNFSRDEYREFFRLNHLNDVISFFSISPCQNFVAILDKNYRMNVLNIPEEQDLATRVKFLSEQFSELKIGLNINGTKLGKFYRSFMS